MGTSISRSYHVFCFSKFHISYLHGPRSYTERYTKFVLTQLHFKYHLTKISKCSASRRRQRRRFKSAALQERRNQRHHSPHEMVCDVQILPTSSLFALFGVQSLHRGLYHRFCRKLAKRIVDAFYRFRHSITIVHGWIIASDDETTDSSSSSSYRCLSTCSASLVLVLSTFWTAKNRYRTSNPSLRILLQIFRLIQSVLS